MRIGVLEDDVARRVKPTMAIRFGAYEINEELRQIRVHGKYVELTQKEP